MTEISNNEISKVMSEVAELLEKQGANPFRVGAYRKVAQNILSLKKSAAALLEEKGIDGLSEIPGVGPSLAHAIEELVLTGRLRTHQRLLGHGDPESVFSSVAGFYRVPAAKNPARTDVNSVVPISVSEILEVDQEYREKASKGNLVKIAPRRFNPTSETWLPILHTKRGQHHYTALYSNTARAHELGMVHDWVIVYLENPPKESKMGSSPYQWTVVTGRFGPLRGLRIIRGREAECRKYYEMAQSLQGISLQR